MLSMFSIFCAYDAYWHTAIETNNVVHGPGGLSNVCGSCLLNVHIWSWYVHFAVMSMWSIWWAYFSCTLMTPRPMNYPSSTSYGQPIKYLNHHQNVVESSNSLILTYTVSSSGGLSFDGALRQAYFGGSFSSCWATDCRNSIVSFIHRRPVREPHRARGPEAPPHWLPL